MHAAYRRLLAFGLVAAFWSSAAFADSTATVTAFGAKRPLPDNVDDRAPGLPNRATVRNAAGVVAEIEDGPPAGKSGLILRIHIGAEHVADCLPSANCSWPGRDGPRIRFGPLGLDPQGIPESRFEFGAAGRLGWSFRYLAAELGASAHSTSFENVDPLTQRATTIQTRSHPSLNAFVRAGPDTSWIGGGYGVSSATTLFYPGFFVRGALRFSDRIQTTLGVAEAKQANHRHWRSDFDLRLRVTPQVSIGDGFTLMFSSDRVMGEFRVFGAYHF